MSKQIFFKVVFFIVGYYILSTKFKDISLTFWKLVVELVSKILVKQVTIDSLDSFSVLLLAAIMTDLFDDKLITKMMKQDKR